MDFWKAGVNYYHKELHLGCCSSPRSASAPSRGVFRTMSNILDRAFCQIAKLSILDVWQGSEYISAYSWKKYLIQSSPYLAGIYLLKVNNKNNRTWCEICSKLTIKTPKRRHWRRSGVCIVNFEHIPYLAVVFLLLTLNM